MKRLKDEEVTELILKIKSGDKRSAASLIENYKGYILSIAYRRANATRVPVDDLISAGFFGLCRAIENINNFSEGNFLAFIAPHIKGEIEDEIADTVFGPSPAGNRKRKQRDQEQNHPKRVPIGRDGEPLTFHWSEHEYEEVAVPKQGWLKHFRHKTELTELDIGELIDEIAQTDREKQVLEYRLQGMTDREIATELGCSHVTVFLTRKTISERLKNGLL